LFKDAVVEVHSEFILLGTGSTGTSGSNEATSATGGTPLSPGGRADVILEGNGFFVKGHYIVAPAQLVLLPPSLTSVVNRYPLFNPNDVSLGQIKNQMIRASRILVSVFNVNNKGHSFVYEADLVGVDGAGDIAVLRVNYKKHWNLCNPCIEKCHPYLNFGSSRCAKEGEKVYLIGDYIGTGVDRRPFNAAGAVTEGILSDHRWLDYSGYGLAESVLVNAPVYSRSAGLPILNCEGQVIGMQTTDLAGVVTRVSVVGEGTSVLTLPLNEGFGLVAGPSEFFMRRVVKSIIKGTCSRKFNCQLETICDPVGAYYRYKKAYAGIGYNVFSGVDYDTTTDYTSTYPAVGIPRVRLSPSGEFLNSPSCKELIGIHVLGLAGLNPNGATGVANGYWYVPGGTGIAPIANYIPNSPFLGKLFPGDIITHINGVALGDLNKQIAPSLITWRLCAGDQLEICYRRGGNATNSSDNSFTENYDNLYTHVGCLADFPYLMDYPWYAVNIFPILRNRGFTFPVGQLTYPQLPCRVASAIFHSAF
jgi:S1-C subfamily serine protease